jgi:4a-hydroxytetrahydrobiopterin dehydratase
VELVVSQITRSRSRESKAVTWLRARSVLVRPVGAGVRPSPSECASFLAEVPDWELRDEARIVARRFRFPDYRIALAFANAVSMLAEENWHHPELLLGWGFCEVSLTTRKIGGLHEFDFVIMQAFPRRCSCRGDYARVCPNWQGAMCVFELPHKVMLA